MFAELCCPVLVIDLSGGSIVLRAVNFDDKFSLMTKEVSYVIVYYVLAIKFYRIMTQEIIP